LSTFDATCLEWEFGGGDSPRRLDRGEVILAELQFESADRFR
jgi:hypothetical protein